MNQKILLFGKDGQLGQALASVLGSYGSLHSVGRNECDLTQSNAVETLIKKIKPHVIVNAAAYTAVDRAQEDSETAERVNAHAPKVMASAAQHIGAAMVHYSSDYVFDGSKSGAYLEDDPCHPVSVYGETKRRGELEVQSHCEQHLILRTSWVFSAQGSNFLKTILKLAKKNKTLRVINDQWGVPTSTEFLAHSTLDLLCKNKILSPSQSAAVACPPADAPLLVPSWGLFHLAPTGETNWHAYAQFILERAQSYDVLGAFELSADSIVAIPSEEYPQLAVRPKNSRLNTQKIQSTFDLHLPSWENGVEQVLHQLANRGEFHAN